MLFHHSLLLNNQLELFLFPFLIYWQNEWITLYTAIKLPAYLINSVFLRTNHSDSDCSCVLVDFISFSSSIMKVWMQLLACSSAPGNRMDLKRCHRTLCVALKHNSIFPSHGEVLSHLSQSNAQFQALTNSYKRQKRNTPSGERRPCTSEPYLSRFLLIVGDLVRTALRSLPPRPRRDSCPPICLLATAMAVFSLQSRT